MHEHIFAAYPADKCSFFSFGPCKHSLHSPHAFLQPNQKKIEFFNKPFLMDFCKSIEKFCCLERKTKKKHLTFDHFSISYVKKQRSPLMSYR